MFARYTMLFLLFAITMAVTSYTAYAAPQVNTAIRSNYARLTFNWDSKTAFDPSANGKTLTIRFDKPATIATAPITSSLGAYVQSASLSADNKTLTLTMKDAYPIRHFISGNANGVDILFKQSPRPTTLVSDTKPMQSAKTEAVKPEPKSVDVATNITPKPALKPDSVARKPAVLTTKNPVVEAANNQPSQTKPDAAVVQQTAQTPAKPSATEKPEPQETAIALPSPLLKPLQTSEQSEATEKPVATAAATEKQPAPDETETSEIKQPAKNALPALLPAVDPNKKMLVSLKKNKLSTQFFFNFAKRTAVAAFERGSDIYVIFNTKQAMDVEHLRSVLPQYITHVDEVPASDATVLRLQRSTDISVTARLSGRGYEWILTASRRPSLPKNITIPNIVNNPPVKPYIFMEALQTAKPVMLTHAVTGELITAIPSYQSSTGTFPQRSTPDVTILKTGQGMAYVQHDTNLRYAKLRNGVRLSSLSGLDVSPNLAPLDTANLVQAEANSHSFFPYSLWKAADVADFYAREQILLQDIASADARQAPHMRLDLVKLYLAEGLYMEALGMLDVIEAKDPDFYTVYQLAALDGAANFMMGRLSEAVQDFNDPVLEGEDEIKQWQRLVGMMNGDKKPISYFSFNKQFAQNYEPSMRRHIAIMAADHAIAQKKYNTLTKILNQLSEDGLLEPVEAHANYLMGRMEAEGGNLDVAKDTLQPLIDNVEDRFLRSRAIFTLATAQYKAGSIDRPQLIASLEPLRSMWRGDAFELNLLNLLGELYVNNGDYLEGLRAWRDVVTYFPNSLTAQDAASRMAATFVELFNEKKADDMTPLAALALYYEFRELTPLGNEGDTMIQNLADRLAGVDLLDKAASLLEHQVTFRLEKEERSRIGAQLALIYLLNREPKKTLDVLELTGYGDNRDELMRKRNHLAALSYAKTGDWQTAINLLRDDYSEQAKYIRLDIYWDMKDWKNVAIVAEDILASREDITRTLQQDEMRALLQLGVAYTFLNDREQLQYLKDYFTPLIDDADRMQSFALITSGIDPVDRDNIALLSQEMNKIEGFLENYRLSLGKQSLSTAF